MFYIKLHWCCTLPGYNTILLILFLQNISFEHFILQRDIEIKIDSNTICCNYSHLSNTCVSVSTDTVDLPEVTVKGERKYLRKELGFYEKDFFDLINDQIHLNSKKFSELYLLFDKVDSVRTIQIKSIKIAKHDKGSYGRMKLRFKAVDSIGGPGKDLYEIASVYDISLIPKELNIEEYNILIPEDGIYIGIELLSTSLNNEAYNIQYASDLPKNESNLILKATDNKYSTSVYIKSSENDAWVKEVEEFVPRIGLIVKVK